MSTALPLSSTPPAQSSDPDHPHRYNAALANALELKWQARWDAEGTFHALNPGEPGFDPAKPKAATPAQTCAFVAEWARILTGSTPSGWSHSGCVRTIAAKIPLLEPVQVFGDPMAQCASYEAGIEEDGFVFQLTYPYAFYADEPDGFPGLIAHDRKQCARALWAFHTLVTLLGPPPGQG